MKKSKVLVLGILAAALVFGMTAAGCDNGPTEVTGTVSIGYGPQIAAPQITAATGDYNGGDVLVLSWDAVANAGAYYPVRRQKDRITIENTSYFSAQVGNQFAYTVSDGAVAQIANGNADKWSALVQLTAAFGTTVLPEYSYGVYANAAGYDGVAGSASNVAWTADHYSLKEHPWTVLVGTWKKDGAGSQPQIVIRAGLSGSTVNGQYVMYDADGKALLNTNYGTTVSTFNIGNTSLSDLYINNFYGVLSDPNTNYADIRYADGKLAVSLRYFPPTYSGYEDTYSLIGAYSKEP